MKRKQILLAVTAAFLTILAAMVTAAAADSVTFTDDFGYSGETYAGIQNEFTAADCFSHIVEATPGEEKSVITTDGYSWRLSSSCLGVGGGAGLIERAGRWNQRIFLSDVNHGGRRIINLDMGRNKIEAVEKISFKMAASTSDYISMQSSGVRFMVSADEKSYYEFGLTSGNFAWSDRQRGAPYITKVTNGVEQLVYAYHGTDWQYKANLDPADFTLTFDGKKITWTASFAYRGVNYNISDSYTDADSPLTECRYPISLFSYKFCRENGDEIRTYFDDIALIYKPSELQSFSEDFSSYNAENNAYTGKENAMIGINADDDDVFAVNGDFTWRFSKLLRGKGGEGKAYIDTEYGVINLIDNTNAGTMINLSTNKEISGVKSVHFESPTSNNQRYHGVRMLINENQDSYYEFGMNFSDDSFYDIVEGDEGKTVITLEDGYKRYRAPYFAKYIDGILAEQIFLNEVWTGNEAYSTSWDVKFTQDGVQWTVNGKGKTWTYRYDDPDIGIMQKYSVYPLGLLNVAHEYGAYFDNIELTYYNKSEAPLYRDNGDGTLTLSIDPSEYTAGDAQMLTAIVAYYGADNSLISCVSETVPVTGGVHTWSVDKNLSVGAYGKIFIWRGSATALSPAANITDIR